MSHDELPIQLPLTAEQQELIHRLTGEHANVLELLVDQAGGTSGTARAINFNWRISVDSGIPRQQWAFRSIHPPTPDQGTPS